MDHFDSTQHPRSTVGRFTSKPGSPPEAALHVFPVFPVADIADARAQHYTKVSQKFPPGTPWAEPDFWRLLDETHLSILELSAEPDEATTELVRELADDMAQQARLLNSVRSIFRAPDPADQAELDRSWDDLHSRYSRMGDQLQNLFSDEPT